MTPLAPLGFFANAPAAAGDYESISTVTVGAGGTSSISFSSIPSTYKHLQIRFIGTCTVSGEYSQAVYMRVNSDTGSNYSRHSLGGNGSTISVLAEISILLTMPPPIWLP